MSSCRVLENLCALSNIMLSLPPVVSYKVSFRSFKNASSSAFSPSVTTSRDLKEEVFMREMLLSSCLLS